MYALKASLGGSATEMQLGWIGVGDRAKGPWLSLEWLLSQSRIPVGFHNQNSPPALVSQDEPKVHQRHFFFGAEAIRHNM
jgi:hypothetical protein